MQPLQLPTSLLIACLLALTRAETSLPPLTQTYQVQDGDLQNIIKTSGKGDVIVGGRNALYQFSPQLDLLSEHATGPKLDNVHCLPDPLDCAEERVETDNQNKVLLQLGEHPIVVACGSVWQGMCGYHSLVRNLSVPISMDKRQFTNYVASREDTVAFFGDGDHGSVLFSASTYDGRPVHYHPFAVAARVATSSGSFDLATRSPHTGSFVNVVERFKTSYKIHYVYGFAYKGFAYFIVVQNAGSSLDLFETRLARVCMSDPTFFTYSEVPIKCRENEQGYSIAEAAYLHDATTLYVTFGKPYSGRGRVNDPSLGSGLCQYKMADVERRFENATGDCNDGKQSAVLLRLFHGDSSSSSLACREFKTDGPPDFCKHGENVYIEGRLHLHGTLTVQLRDRLMTSILALQQNRNTVVWIGDNEGYLYKYKIEGKTFKLLYSGDVSREAASDLRKPIRKSVAVDADGSYGYFLTGRRVVKFPVGSCSLYPDCSTCMKSGDPLGCGWCGDKCAHGGECEGNVDRDTCPVSILKIFPLRGPPSGGTLLTVEGDNLGSPEHVPHSSLAVTVGGAPCQIHSWTFTRVQCRTPPMEDVASGGIVVSVNDTHYSVDKPYDIVDTRVADVSFDYTEVAIADISPTYGPVSGGTTLTITGDELDTGASRSVTIGPHPCHISSVTSDKIECITENVTGSAEERGPFDVTLEVDGYEVPRVSASNTTFTYRPDPVIVSIHPKTAPYRGGTTVTASGKHLDSVETAFLVFRVTSLNHERHDHLRQPCSRRGGGVSLECSVPPLYNSSVFDEDQLRRHDLPVLVRGHFQMDGLRLSDGGSAFNFVYRPNPHFDAFPGDGNSAEVGPDDPTLEIPGRGLDGIAQKKEVNVRVSGKDYACNVTHIQARALWCNLAPGELLPEAEHPVEVILAGKSYSIGVMRVVPRRKANYGGIVAGVVVSAVIAVLLLVGVLYYVRERRRKAPPDYFVDFTNRAEDGARSPGANNYVQGNEADSRQALIAPGFQLDEETKAMLESEKILFQRQHLTLGPVIGQGHFGCVYRGTLELAGKGEVLSVAVKTLHNNSRGVVIDGQAFLEEAMIMKDFHHTNVLSLIGLCVDADGQLMVITPYMKYGDLLSYIRDEQNSPTVKELITYGIHVAEGMEYLSSQKFVHRDLAARNCMLSEDYVVRVADFGLSRDVYEKDYYSGDNKKTKLPVKWMALESLEKGIYNHKTDVWAYGVVLWELMTRGVTPYPEVDNWDIVNFLKQGRRMQQPSFCPDLLYEIMLQCWDEDPKRRPSFSGLVQQVTGVITALEKKRRNRRVGLKVTYVNYPRTEEDAAGPSRADAAAEEDCQRC